MKCEEVRAHLAAYRRSDWSLEEQRAVSQHLATCNACRRWEAEARRVGEHLRQMPSITPPESLRERVFAAIQREALATPPLADPIPAPPPPPKLVPFRPAAMTNASPYAITKPLGEATSERVGEVAIGRMRPPRVLLGKQTAIATVAALFLIMFAAHLFPLTHSAPNNLGLAVHPPTPAPYAVQADPRYPTIVSAIADDQQVIYVGVAPTSHQYMILAQARQGSQWQMLLPQSSAQPITIVALTHSALYWIVDAGKSTWALQAAPFTDGLMKPLAPNAVVTLLAGGQAITEPSSATATPTSASGNGASATTSVNVTALSGIWAQDHSALAAVQTADGRMALVEMSWPSGQNAPPDTVVTVAQPGHTLTHPYLDNGAAYWVDKTVDATGMAQGVIWEAVGQKTPQPLGVAGNAFGPVADGQRLIWFQPTPATSSAANVDASLVDQVMGNVEARDSATGPARALTSSAIGSAQVWRGQGYVLWRDTTGAAHLYELSANVTQDVQLPGHYDALALSATSIAWATTPPTPDAATAGTITVVDLP